FPAVGNRARFALLQHIQQEPLVDGHGSRTLCQTSLLKIDLSYQCRSPTFVHQPDAPGLRPNRCHHPRQ
ncbi:MAG: hypothetical protein ACK56I_28420, partial [bacterium]